MNLKNFLLYNRYDTNAPRFPTSQQKYDEMVRLFNKYNLKTTNCEKTMQI